MKIENVIIGIVILTACIMMLFTYSDSGVRFISEQGELCGCMVDSNAPSMRQCDVQDDLVRNGKMEPEVIEVSSC